MNRRKFLQFLGIVPIAPALAKVAVEETAVQAVAIPDFISVPYKPYYGKGIVQMLMEQEMERTRNVMAENLLTNVWQDELEADHERL